MAGMGIGGALMILTSIFALVRAWRAGTRRYVRDAFQHASTVAAISIFLGGVT